MKPIVAAYGTLVQVEVVYRIAGTFVWLDVGEEFARLTPNQADDLAEQLKAKAAEARG